MGKGDRKTRKGKTNISSYGNVRPHKAKPAGAATAAVRKPAVARAGAAAKKAAPRKKG